MNVDNQIGLIKPEEIFNILKREIQLANSVQSIPPNFYQNISILISVLNSDSNQKKESDMYENKERTDKVSKQIKSNLIDLIVKLTTMLFIYRCKKIFNYSNNINNSEVFDYSNLTDEEKYVFYGNREKEQRINTILNLLFEGKSSTLEKIVSSINQNFIILRFLDSMEQFVGVNMNKYGPFKKDDIAILPFENARSIIENNKAIEVYRIV